MKILVTGGAGYIGSHTVVRLLEQDHEVVVVDDFSNSSPVVLDRIEEITGRRPELVEADLSRPQEALPALAPLSYDAVVHFAALKSVAASVADPLTYYRTNLTAVFTVLEAMRQVGARLFVFSSSATVYGASPVTPSPEDHPVAATNPYGWTKVMGEQILRDVAAAEPDWAIAVLRYFNPVGAHPSALIGENPTQAPTNLMPLVARVAAGQIPSLAVYGDDYPTPDGTAVRDFIHVEDLAAGHVRALEHLADHPGVHTWNLGTGTGTSVLEIIDTFKAVSGAEIPYTITARRPGDVAVSQADPRAAYRDLGWRAEKTLQDMCRDLWAWHTAAP